MSLLKISFLPKQVAQVSSLRGQYVLLQQMPLFNAGSPLWTREKILDETKFGDHADLHLMVL